MNQPQTGLWLVTVLVHDVTICLSPHMKTDPAVLQGGFFYISVIFIWNDVESFQRISTHFILDKPSCLFWQLHCSPVLSRLQVHILSCPCSTYLRNVWIIMVWPLNPGRHYQASCLSLAQSDLMGWITSFFSEKNNFSASHRHTLTFWVM